jgi:hypothetical protein
MQNNLLYYSQVINSQLNFIKVKKFFFTVTILLQIVSIGRSQESIFNIFDGILPRSTGTTPNIAAIKSDVESDISKKWLSSIKFLMEKTMLANFKCGHLKPLLLYDFIV